MDVGALQTQICRQLVQQDGFQSPIRYVGGLHLQEVEEDRQAAVKPVAHDLPLLHASAFSVTCSGHAALVVVQLPSLQLVFQDTVDAQCLPPYQAGFLGLRHCPTFMRLLERAAQSVYCPQVGLLTFCAIPEYMS